MNVKIASLVFVFSFDLVSAEFTHYQCKENYNENDFLNEIIDAISENSETDHNLCICGNFNVNAIGLNQKISGEKENEKMNFRGNINVKYLGSTDGYGYGAAVNVKTNSGELKRSQPILDSTYVFLEFDKFGEIQFGYMQSAASKFNINGGNVLKGYGSFSSNNLSSFYNLSSGTIIGTESVADDKNALKIAWTSPLFKGFSFGASYSFSGKNVSPFNSDRRKRNEGKGSYAWNDNYWDFRAAAPYSKNLLTVGASYEYGSQNDIFAKFSLSGWFGKGKTDRSDVKIKNVKALNLGAILGYKDLKASFGFMNSGKSLLAAPTNVEFSGDSGKIYSLGISYKINEKIEISAGRLQSRVKFSEGKSIGKVATAALEYVLEEHLKAYCEYDFVRTKTCTAALALAENSENHLPKIENNRANIFMIGMKWEF